MYLLQVDTWGLSCSGDVCNGHGWALGHLPGCSQSPPRLFAGTSPAVRSYRLQIGPGPLQRSALSTPVICSFTPFEYELCGKCSWLTTHQTLGQAPGIQEKPELDTCPLSWAFRVTQETGVHKKRHH
ncbi:hypothetical protein TREES_T100020933 [Tupaia chinensis]|uniref:Uncharacterized protein n=1 Tax=Tupaia chinensis TaxID=246437 RepID=L9JE25_TUPCH|nr:hypothetical protein TREES_T100020933 [Tupaia chinensis]